MRISTWHSVRAKVLGIAAAVCLVALPARAQDSRVQFDVVQREADGLLSWAMQLEQAAADQQGLLDRRDAQLRYEEGLFAWMTGDHQRSAEVFWGLTRLMGPDPLRDESEWYLAQSLIELEHHDLALVELDKASNSPDHPFRDAAAHLKLRVLADLQRHGEFASFLESLDREGRLDRDEELTYLLGRSRMLLGEPDAAEALLAQIPSTSPLASRALYIRGAIQVQSRDLERAKVLFQQTREIPVFDDEQQQVYDLAILALARIAYEQGRDEETLELYSEINGTSSVLKDSLHESVWTSLRLGDHATVVQLIELYLLFFPEDAIAGRLRVVLGHVRMAQEDWEGANAAYESIATEYDAIYTSTQQAALNDPELPLRLAKGDDVRGIPEWVADLWQADPMIADALSVHDDMQQQAQLLDDAESLLGQLDRVLTRLPTLSRHVRVHEEAVQNLYRTTGMQLNLCTALSQRAVPKTRDRRQTLAELRGQLDAAKAQWRDRSPWTATTPGGTALRYEALKALSQTTDELHLALAEMIPREDVAQSAQFARTVLLSTRDHLDGARASITESQRELISPMRQQLDEQRTLLTALGQERQTVSIQTDALWAQAATHGTEQVDRFLQTSVLDAHAGMADASWAQLLEVREDREETIAERSERLRQITELFEELSARTGD